jgi:hypothetical protein
MKFSQILDNIGLAGDPDFKGAIAVSTEVLAHLSRPYRLRTSTLRMMKGAGKMRMKGLFLYRELEVFMFQPINDKMKFLIASGLTDFWVNQYIAIKTIPDDNSPKILTLADLGIGFQVCLVPLTFSLVAFFIENLKKPNCRRFKK